MKNRILVIQHGHNPPDDRVHTWLSMNGYRVDIRKPFAGEPIGEITDDLAGSVIHGGRFNSYAHDNHPFLRDEDCWIGDCLKHDIPLLGICQGCQQIALHLGAGTGPRKNGIAEFGYYEIQPGDNAEDFLPGPLFVAQSHFHTFNLPPGSRHLARSERFENQAFSYGDKIFGMQFHPEVTIEGFRRWQNAKFNLAHLPGAQEREEQTRLSHLHDEAQANWFFNFLEIWLGSIAGQEPHDYDYSTDRALS